MDIINDNVLVSSGEKTIVYNVRDRRFRSAISDIHSVKEYLKQENYSSNPSEVLNKIDEQIAKKELKTLTFNASEHCNLKCRYCFAKDGTYNNQSCKKEMTFMDYKKGLMAFKNEGIERINFFGGEPLLNFKELEKFCRYLREYSKQNKTEMPKLGIITNGTFLNEEVFSFLGEYDFGITISIDGPQKIHDGNRIYKNGKGSFADVYKNITKQIKRSDKSIIFDACEATLTIENLCEMSDVDMDDYFEFFENLPCKTIGILFALEDKIDSYLEDSRVVNQIEKFYSHYTNYCIKKIINGTLQKKHLEIINNILAVLQGGEYAFCNAGISQIFINVKGEVFPCQRYYLEEKKMGHIDCPEAILHEVDNIKRTYKNRISQQCLECAIHGMCYATSCAGNNLAINGKENECVKFLCVTNKIRCEAVIKQMYNVVSDEKQNKLFVEKMKNYIKRVGNDEENIFEQ